MSESQVRQDSESRPTGVGPGERLQAARIQQGLSLEDVANRMHLSPNILEAIEENNFDEITAPIFVKGYLRAYARIVSLDEDEMIRQYVDFYSEDDPPISSTSNTVPELSSSDASIKWTTYLVIVILAALLAAWWWNKQQTVETTISLDAQQSETDAPEAVSEDSAVISEIEAVSERLDTENLANAESLNAEADEDPAPAEEASPETVSEAVEPEAPTAPAQAAETAVAEVDTAEPEVTASVASGAAGPVDDPDSAARATDSRPRVAQIAPSGSDKLRVVVHADSWADIKDATGFQLAYDLLRADASVELVGEAPFSVFLGNGHGVELIFNGEDVNLAPRIRADNTARLKIGP